MDIDLTVVLPVYNNRSLAKASAQSLHTFLSKHFNTFEIIIVDDGSQSTQSLRNEKFDSNVEILRNEINKGKGAAVKKGMIAAQGKCQIYTDIDLPYDLQAILDAYKIITRSTFHFVAGDRTHSKSTKSTNEPLSRTYTSFMFRKSSSLLVTGKAIDTQCGFKAFSDSLAKVLFPLLTINRFAFDIEIFYLLLKLKVPFTTIPVNFINSNYSSVHIVSDGIKTFLDTLLIPIRWHMNSYPRKMLRRVQLLISRQH